MRLLSFVILVVPLASACPAPPDPGAEPLDASVGDTDAGGDIDASVTDGGADASPEDLCAVDNGGCDALTECTEVDDQVSCGACPAGYTGDGLSGCVDIDECASVDEPCGPDAFCTNTPGAYSCLEWPTEVVLLSPRMTETASGADAQPHLSPCPPGEVAIGYRLRYHATHSRIETAEAICSPLTLNGSGPEDYFLTTTPPSWTSTEDRLCPANEVVVGMDVAVLPDVQSMTVRCATISVQFDAASGFTMVTGESHPLPRFPHESSADPDAFLTCPSGTVGAGETWYGGQWLAGFAMRCVRPAMRLDLPSISFGAETDAPFVGISSSSPEHRDMCPAGQMVTGIRFEGQKRSFAVECGEPLFDRPVRVAMTPGPALPYHGEIPPRFALRCGNAALAQLHLGTHSGRSIVRLDMKCSALTASDTPEWTASVNEPVPGPHWGQLAVPINQVTACPAGTVAVGAQSRMTTQSNGYVTLTHLGLVCAAPQVP